MASVTCFHCGASLHCAPQRFVLSRRVASQRLGYVPRWRLLFCGVQCLAGWLAPVARRL